MGQNPHELPLTLCLYSPQKEWEGESGTQKRMVEHEGRRYEVIRDPLSDSMVSHRAFAIQLLQAAGHVAQIGLIQKFILEASSFVNGNRIVKLMA